MWTTKPAWHATAMLLAGLLCAAIGAGVARPAHATFHTWQINELYSNADGSVQFIEMHEGSNANGQELLKGHTITVTQGVTTHTFTFPNNLPNSNTANKSFLIATPGFSAVTPDYVVPAGFLFINGGTVDYAGVDSLSYASLPTDGVMSLNRDGTTSTNSPTNFAGQSGTIGAPPPPPPPSAPAPFGIPTLDPWALASLVILLLLVVWARVFGRRSR